MLGTASRRFAPSRAHSRLLSPSPQAPFEDGLGDWTIPGAPDGSVANPNDWQRVGVLFEIASIVATDDTLLFGFGFEGVTSADERNEVMRRSLAHLLG